MKLQAKISPAAVTIDLRLQHTAFKMNAAQSLPSAGPGRLNAAPSDKEQLLQPCTRDAMLSELPGLRAFAASLCGNVDHADDLVQETLLRAVANIHSFRPATNLPAWMFTILRNQFWTEYRKGRREVEDIDDRYLLSMKSAPEQDARLELEEFRAALAKLLDQSRTRAVCRLFESASRSSFLVEHDLFENRDPLFGIML